MVAARLRTRHLGLALVALVVLGGLGRAGASPPDPEAERERAIFGEPTTTPTSPSEGAEGEGGEDETAPVPATPLADEHDEDAIFGGSGAEPDGGSAPPGDARFGAASPSFELQEDPLTIGGMLYLRFASTFNDGVPFEDATLSMPNLLDLYLDARPDPRVRGFFSGRLRYDPTVAAGARDLLGQAREPAKVLVDQLWLKTDIARRVFLTVGQQRIKWGASRLFNPTDFINSVQRDPLALFDERTGVPLVKVHVPIESLGWNAYGLLLLGGAETLSDVGYALRLEMVFGTAEIALSGAFGGGRKTQLGADLSAGVGDFDVTLEVAVTDETDRRRYSGDFDLATLTLPTSEAYGAWAARVSGGIQYEFKPNDDDMMIVGVEYYYNPLGYTDPTLYPYLLLTGAAKSLELGQHYAGLVWAWPAPLSWDDGSIAVSTLANLSDPSFVTRLDVSARVHTRLTIEAYVQAHYGKRGGELRFGLEVPDLPAIPGFSDEPTPAFSVPPPLLMVGLNLRVAL